MHGLYLTLKRGIAKSIKKYVIRLANDNSRLKINDLEP